MTAAHRILVTGSRQWHDQHRPIVEAAIQAAMKLLEPSGAGDFTIVHGGARGLDSQAAAVAAEHGLRAEAHYADWNAHRDKPSNPAGYIRNQQMVDAGADLCLSFPLHRLSERGKDTSRGTWHCTQAAAKAAIPTLVVWSHVLFAFNQQAHDLLSAERVPLNTPS